MSLPSFITYKEEAVVLRTIHAKGWISCRQVSVVEATAAGEAALAALPPFPPTRVALEEERQRLRRPSPLVVIRTLKELAARSGFHLFCSLSYEAAHIFDDLELPEDPFCEFLLAEVETVPTAECMSEVQRLCSTSVCDDFVLLSNTSPQFQQFFSQGREHLRLGDVFEIVLSRQFVFSSETGSDAEHYRHIARGVAGMVAPYRFAMDFPQTRLVGASPELLVHVEKGWVTNRPISGSMRRESSEPQLTPAEEKTLSELYNSEKEKNELDMLVDLARHDLHRICSKVELSRYREALILESVVHTQSTVRGKLRPECDALDAVFSCLNAGTLVGAPKKKAMEIIGALEGGPRRFYGGNLLHLAPHGGLKSTILIRTFQIKEKKVTLQAGATVLHDSSEDYEYWECGAKARSLLKLLDHEHLAVGSGAPPAIDARTTPGMNDFPLLKSFSEVKVGASVPRLAGQSPRVLLIDNHDSFTFNLTALFEHLGCSVWVVRNDAQLPPRGQTDLLVLSPGPSAPKDAGNLLSITSQYETHTPIFGVCLGFQAMVEARGGSLGVLERPYHGKTRPMTLTKQNALTENLASPLSVARYHSLFATAVPPSFEVFCTDSAGRPMGICDLRMGKPPHCGVQFHPESFMSGTSGVTLALNWLRLALRYVIDQPKKATPRPNPMG